MATVPVKPIPAHKPTETMEQQFRHLEAIWLSETGCLSDPDEIIHHAAFREIVHLGEAVVPLMMRDLEERPRLWVWALQEILGVDPVPPGDRGNIAKMSAAWLLWGKKHGYQS